jgi:hypothetical protein
MHPAEPPPSQPAPGKLKPALAGGVALGIASAVPGLNLVNCACCALVLGGGMLAAYLYLKRSPPSAQAPYGDGALVGIAAGVVGAIVATLLSIPMAPVNQAITRSLGMGGDPEQLREALAEADLPPQIEDLLVSLSSGEITVAGLLIGFAFNLILFSLFAMVGALIGVAVFHKKALPPPLPAA